MSEYKNILENYFICSKCGNVHHNNERARKDRKWCKDCHNEYQKVLMQKRRKEKGK